MVVSAAGTAIGAIIIVVPIVTATNPINLNFLKKGGVSDCARSRIDANLSKYNFFSYRLDYLNNFQRIKCSILQTVLNRVYHLEKLNLQQE